MSAFIVAAAVTRGLLVGFDAVLTVIAVTFQVSGPSRRGRRPAGSPRHSGLERFESKPWFWENQVAFEITPTMQMEEFHFYNRSSAKAVPVSRNRIGQPSHQRQAR